MDNNKTFKQEDDIACARLKRQLRKEADYIDNILEKSSNVLHQAIQGAEEKKEGVDHTPK